MRRFKHIAAFALSAIMAVSLSVTAFAADTVTFYRDTTSSEATSLSLSVEKGVKLSSIKPNVSWLKPQSLDSSSGKIEYTGDLKDLKPVSYGEGTIILKASKTGPAKVTYKVGSKSYTKDIEVLPYTNPIKSITVPALNNGKNMASKTKKSSVAFDIKATDTKSNQSLKVTAASGWKIAYLGYSNLSTGKHAMKIYSNTKPTTAYLNIGKITPDTMGLFSVILVNKKTGGSLEINYGFGEN